MKKIISGLVAASALAITGCVIDGGGSGGTTTGGYYLTHEQLASEFVRRLNLDLGYDVELVKSNTRQFNYIVVYDYDFDTYDAYYIGGFNPGESIGRFVDLNKSREYLDLDPIGGGLYQDYDTGLVFEKVQPSPKDRMKMQAFKEALALQKGTEQLQAQFGLSQERSFEIAKLAVVMQKRSDLTTADYDRFAQGILGHSISEYQAAAKKKLSGNGADLNALLADTAQLNGVSPEQMNKIVGSVFGLQP
jgi:hypothetical protein